MKTSIETINGKQYTVVWHYGKCGINEVLPMPLHGGVEALVVGDIGVKLEDMFL